MAIKTPTRLQTMLKPIFEQHSSLSIKFHCMISKIDSGRNVNTMETAPKAQTRLPSNNLFKP